MVQKTILVAEDNSMNAELLRAILEAKGYRVLCVAKGDEAVKVALKKKPDLILMDLQLPGIDGYEATRRIKSNKETKNIPVIAVTAHALKGDREKAIDAGCDDYIKKPIDTREVPELVARYIGESN